MDSIVKKFNVFISTFVDSEKNAGRVIPLGLCYRNIGCIRYSKENRWIGQTGSYKGFCMFSHYNFGLRALIFLLCRYVYHYEIKDLWSLINRYSPSEDGNNVNAYYNKVNYIVGFDSFSDIDKVKMKQICMIAYAIVSVEVGLFFQSFIKQCLYNEFLQLSLHYCKEYLANVRLKENSQLSLQFDSNI